MKNLSKKKAIFAICSTLVVLAVIGAVVILIHPKGKSKDEESAIVFGTESGVYTDEFELTVTARDDTVKHIYYTMDGSNPTTSTTRKEYESPVPIVSRAGDANVLAAVNPGLFDTAHVHVNNKKNGFNELLMAPDDSVVDKCTVFKAAAEFEDGTYSDVVTGTYFIGTMEDHVAGTTESSAAQPLSKLAIISISMEFDDLFDEEKGIYVRGTQFEEALSKFLALGQKLDAETARHLDANYASRGREWERPAHVDFFESDGTTTELKLSQDCGIRIQGNYSRSEYQKSFRLFARSEYGGKNFKYPFFGDACKDEKGETVDAFDSLILRAGGNCVFSMKYNTDYWASLITELDVSTQNSRPCIVYLNGEYWGLYVMQEDFSADYFEDRYGVAKEDVVLYKGDAEKYASGYKLDIGDLPEGVDNEDYYFSDLWDFFNTHEDCKNEADYNALCELVDPQSVLDNFAVQIWINNKWDWPGKNWSMWKTINVDPDNPYADGRFRFCCYDLEFGGICGSSEAKTNTIKEDNYKPNGMLDFNTNNPSVLCFAYMMTNKSFRDAYLDKLVSLSTEEFAYDVASERLDEFRNSYAPLYDQSFKRYNNLGSARDCDTGGYSSVKCIKDYLKARADYIPTMVKWVRKFYGDV